METTTPKRVKNEIPQPNEKNPRFIRDEKYKKLLASISAFPDMLLARPIIVDEYGVILGGNMRWRAAKELGHTHVNVVVVKGWSDEQKNEFVIKDNLNYGEWDFDMLANEFNVDLIKDWGIEIYVPEADIDMSVLDGAEIEDRIQQMQSDVKKAILIEFESEDYEEAHSLISYFRDAGEPVGKMILWFLRQEKEKR